MVKPSKKWGGESLLGTMIKWEDFAEAHQKVLQVTEVAKGSPADVAGLKSDIDYILGNPQVIFDSVDDFATLINVNVNVAVELFVFSYRTH